MSLIKKQNGVKINVVSKDNPTLRISVAVVRNNFSS